MTNVHAKVRAERVDDHAAIGDVIRAAFRGKLYAAGDEAELVEKLRQQRALVVSLVAELDGRVIGQITFSPAFPADGSNGWYALGPVAVLPDHQLRGVGSRLIDAGLERIVDMQATGCILTGNPEYYRRFGFVVSPSQAPAGEPSESFMIKSFKGRTPPGHFRFHPAFHPDTMSPPNNGGVQ